MTNRNYDVIIIGAGIVGTCIARELSKYKVKVLLLEKEADVSMGSTKANSAIVHGGYAEDHSKLKGRVCYKGRIQFEQLDKELNFGFRKTGSLVVTKEENIETLEYLLENGKKNELKDIRIIGAKEIQELEPNISKDLKWALYCEGAGVCSPYEMAIAMTENAMHNGVELGLENQVQAIIKQDSEFKVMTNQGEYHAKYVVNAAGLYSDQISAMVGVDDFQILPRSGEYLLFRRGTGKKLNNVIFQMPTPKGKGVLVTSTYYGNLMIGPDANDDSTKEDTSTHVERIAHIYNSARGIYDGFNPREFIRSYTGIRARSTTDDFIIEETKVKGFINVAGIQSPGLTSSPAIAEMVKDILKETGLELVENPNFDPYRKPIVTKHDLKPIKEIKEQLDLPLGAEGRMVCRCEQVLESEIVDALHRGIELKTIDAIKRRTRATMGWCQGEFCRPRVLEVVEREYGKKISELPDVAHSGVNRVQKSELVDFLKAQEDKGIEK